mgnify:FL=1|tara:strand:+ start:2252 stop:2509 length:258 start_codon:yes stop_codon:yes gene_type:complete
MKHSGFCECGYETPLVEDEGDIDWDLLNAHQEFCEVLKGQKNCNLLRHYIQSIGDIIYHQMPLKEQDQWLDDMITLGLYVVEEGE